MLQYVTALLTLILTRPGRPVASFSGIRSPCRRGQSNIKAAAAVRDKQWGIQLAEELRGEPTSGSKFNQRLCLHF